MDDFKLELANYIVGHLGSDTDLGMVDLDTLTGAEARLLLIKSLGLAEKVLSDNRSKRILAGEIDATGVEIAK